jgi:nifR3 family TIM-barrel protein
MNKADFIGKLYLGPMAGVTDLPFRLLCRECGADIVVTEMISAKGLFYGSKNTAPLLMTDERERPVGVQLFGREPDIVAEAAKRISELGIYDGIDLNMGCPAKKIAPSGEGCGLMRTPETACRMMEKTVKVSVVPVSIKMRTGYDKEHINVVQFAKMAEDAGISSITVHGRTREQQYSGEADWEEIQRVSESVSIPVLGNGDIFSAGQAVSLMKKYRVAGVMIGRGAMGNPWIFRQIAALSRGGAAEAVSSADRLAMIRTHYGRMLAWKPKQIAVREMRKHIGWYIHGLRGASRCRAEINRTEEPEAVLRILEELISEGKD